MTLCHAAVFVLYCSAQRLDALDMSCQSGDVGNIDITVIVDICTLQSGRIQGLDAFDMSGYERNIRNVDLAAAINITSHESIAAFLIGVVPGDDLVAGCAASSAYIQPVAVMSVFGKVFKDQLFIVAECGDITLFLGAADLAYPYLGALCDAGGFFLYCPFTESVLSTAYDVGST